MDNSRVHEALGHPPKFNKAVADEIYEVKKVWKASELSERTQEASTYFR